MDLKTVQVTGLKAGPDDGLEEGQAWAYASTWTREPDSYGDVVAKGAFADTLREWKASGNELPILFGHNMSDPEFFIGGAKEMLEDDHGLKVLIDFDLTPGSKSEKVYRLVKGKRITQLSFAYDVLESGDVQVPKAGGAQVTARELRKLKLYEVSVVPVGANQDTEVLAVKAIADGLKAGKVLSSKNLSSLKVARDALNEVLDAAGDGEGDNPKEQASQAAQVDEGQEPKSATAKLKSAEAIEAFIATL